MTEVAGPCRAAEGYGVRACERIRLRRQVWRPCACQAARRERPVPTPTVRPDCFLQQQVLVDARYLVDRAAFEQGEPRILQGDDGVAEPIREVRERRLRTVDVPIVVAREQIAVAAVADHPEVEP